MESIADLERPLPETSWINFHDPASSELDSVAAARGYHPLDIEDCRHRNQMAKASPHDGYTFIVIKEIRFSEEDLSLDFDDFDIFISPSEITTIEETPDCTIVDRVAARLRNESGPVPVWRIAHALLDTTVDDYLPVLDRVGGIIDQVETAVLEEPSPAVLERILSLKRLLIEFRRNAAAMREVLNHLVRDTQPGEDRYLYLRDVYDHLVRALDFCETYRDLVSGALDIYLSAIANRTNEIVKVLTIWGTIALPMLVVTGFYGMNVALPMQQSAHAVTILCGLLIACTIGIVVFFRRKGWM
jgi:magnesium transporter